MPWEVEEMVKAAQGALPNLRLGIHAHNDGECGVANSVAAVRAGARHVQGTINGYGERCGNANLCAIIPDLELKLGLQCLPRGWALAALRLGSLRRGDREPQPERARRLRRAERFCAQGRRPRLRDPSPPGIVRTRRTRPSWETSRAWWSASSRGARNVLSKAEELGLEVSSTHGGRVLERIKELESKGFAYEAAEASVALLMARHQDRLRRPV